ncbi:MAG: TonB family protein [Acidobacteriota bacterium]|jgi:periplasmic protein TonB
MSDEERSFLLKAKQFFEWLLALKVTDEERVRYADDPLNVFGEDISNQKPLRVAAILAILFHILLFVVSLPFLHSQVLLPSKDIIALVQLAQPSLPKGGAPPQPEVEKPKPKKVVPKPKPILVPIPDPTPFEPEPIEREVVLNTPKVVDEMTADLNLGDISAPSGGGHGTEGTGTGSTTGEGSAAGAGDGIYTLGGGVSPPVVIQQTMPAYTDEAIKAKAQGVVLLMATIRKDGRVTDFQVVRGLGYGLEEKAIEEIAANWRFRPGTWHGQPVNVRATIEVQFNLR